MHKTKTGCLFVEMNGDLQLKLNLLKSKTGKTRFGGKFHLMLVGRFYWFFREFDHIKLSNQSDLLLHSCKQSQKVLERKEELICYFTGGQTLNERSLLWMNSNFTLMLKRWKQKPIQIHSISINSSFFLSSIAVFFSSIHFLFINSSYY